MGDEESKQDAASAANLNADSSATGVSKDGETKAGTAKDDVDEDDAGEDQEAKEVINRYTVDVIAQHKDF